jgi:hypothetical protein
MGKVWTDEEKDLIRKYKGTRSNKQLAKMLGCTEHQLTYAMRKFNIKRTWYEYTSLWEKWGGNRKGMRSFGGRPQSSAAKKPVHFRGLDYPKNPVFKRPFSNEEDLPSLRGRFRMRKIDLLNSQCHTCRRRKLLLGLRGRLRK